MENIQIYPGSLHNHTEYSNLRLRDCIIRPEELIDYAIELGQEVVAITDHECVSNAVRVEKYYNSIKENNPNFKLIRGNEIYLVRNGLNADNYNRETDRYYHFILLAKDLVGMKQIFEISTRAWKRSYMARGMRRVPTYYQDLIDIIGKNPGHIIGSTGCFKAGTQVETMHGWKNIENIQAGDFVINRYGEWEEVIEPTAMFTHQYGYSFEVTGNERPIICTDNHEFLVITNNSKKPKWVQAKDLNLTPRSNSKHIALEPVNHYYNQKSIIYKREWNNSYLRETQFSHKQINLPEEIIITPELMRLFGLFLGDGCISLKQNPRISFTFNEKEYETYMQSFINKASEELGITWSVSKRPENHRVDITSGSVDLINLFYYLFGDVKADTKYVPLRLRVSKELDYELIFGYFLADGYFRTRTNAGKATGYNSGEFVSASISKQLSYDIYQILNELNITSSISYSKERIDNNGVHHKEAWYVTGANKILGNVDKIKPYTHEEIINIFEEAVKVKKKDFITIDGIRYRKIRFKSATKIELNETVYCLNNTTHSFKCENLIVHNCLGGAIPVQILRAKENKKLLPLIENWLQQMDSIFGHGNFFLELQPSHNKDQIYVNKALLQYSTTLNIPYIITTDSHYLKKEDRVIHKAYLNAQNGDREVDSFYATTYLMDTNELEGYFEYFSKEQIYEAYNNIRKIKDMCEDFTIQKPLRIPRLQWKECADYQFIAPKYYSKIPYLKTFYESDYEGDKKLADNIVYKLENDKIHEFDNDETYEAINDNLQKTWDSSIVNKTHWSAYFLNLQKNIEECWNAGTIVGPGRGSGVGFILLYLLDIIQINCLREPVKTYSFRFLNPVRVSPIDVDTDIEGRQRTKVLEHFRKVYGEDRVANVATFKTEKSKSAILTAARGLGLDVDIAQYLSSLVPSDRGMIRSLDQCMYGDEENGFAPIKQFVIEMTENYPEVWKVAHKIENLICGYGLHAGGVIFVDEPFTESTALLRAPEGTIATQFDLHDDEACSLIKIDLLSVECLDKIHICLDLLKEYGYIDKNLTLREAYEQTIGIYNLDRNSEEMWKMVWNHKIFSLFQMEKQSGINGIDLTKPKSIEDLAHLNSIIRLMAQEKGAETPLEKYSRYKENIKLWYEEMERYGLTENEIKVIEPVLKGSYGICESQEAFMTLLQIPECGGFDLNFADKVRKAIAKKNPKAYEELTEIYFKTTKEKGLSPKLCNYVWNVCIATSRGYGFNLSHTLAYSLVALQEMNLAYKFPIEFWNCANLISDSGSGDTEDEDNSEKELFEDDAPVYSNEMEEFTEEDNDEDIENSYEEEDCDGYPAEVEVLKDGKKKKKVKSTNYGRISAAIGKMKMEGIQVAPPDINNSTYTFSPDPKNHIIRYGISGISMIGGDLVKEIIDKRPYTSIEDFISRVKISKPKVVNLIKSGAFDEFGDRIELMKQYIDSIADKKKRITLQNMKMLIEKEMIPEEFEKEIKIFNFNKYLKKNKNGKFYILNNYAVNFYNEYFNPDNLQLRADGEFQILQTVWDKIYDNAMNPIRAYFKANQKEILDNLNDKLVSKVWNKYAKGSISAWEMDSVSYYSHPHELEKLDNNLYGISDFYELPLEPQIDRIITIKGKQIPLYKIIRVAGTVLDRDKAKKTITLLTTSGVITVKIFGQVFAFYDKQISERGEDGKKHVIQKSMFRRGNKIIVSGIRTGENEMLGKKYKSTPWHLCEEISKINEDGTIETLTRYDE